jgi:non-specific serine/threonine protein kinase
MLVTGTHKLVVLATSRQSLGIAGEQVLPVTPLAVPDAAAVTPESLTLSEAARLFVDRAVAVLPSFEVTPEIASDLALLCRHLDGLPLAIELAAARLRSLSVRQMVQRLTHQLPLLTTGVRTAPERQQTLRATIDWSYGLCSDLEQLVWQRASAFSGTFGIEAAEHVCGGAGIAASQVLDIIDGLLDKSVLIREELQGRVRYRMLETLREYGHERLEQAGDRPRVARLHRDWYADLVIRFGQEWLGPDQVAWVDRLRRDHSNLRVASEFTVTQPGESVVLVRMGLATQHYWTLLGMIGEARLWLERALPGVPRDVPEYGAVLWMSGLSALIQNDLAVAAARLTAAGEFAERTGDAVLAAHVKQTWGAACVFGGDYPQAVGLLEAALITLRANDVLEGELFAWWMLGMGKGLGGDVGGARVALRTGLARSEGCGEIYFRGWLLDALAHVEMIDGQIEAAAAAGARALRVESSIGNMFALALTTSLLARVAFRRVELRRAATLFGAADTVWSAVGATPHVFPAFGTGHDRYLDRTRSALGPARFEAAYAEGRAMRGDRTVRYALGEDTAEPEPSTGQSPLTRREAEVAKLVAKGLTNRQIAATLTIAPRTADTHVERILTKLGFSSRTQIAAWVVSGDRKPSR